MKEKYRVVQYEDATLIVNADNDAVVRMGSGGYSDNHRNRDVYRKLAEQICCLLNSLGDDLEIR